MRISLQANTIWILGFPNRAYTGERRHASITQTKAQKGIYRGQKESKGSEQFCPQKKLFGFLFFFNVY
jgi:hypothetical protein